MNLIAAIVLTAALAGTDAVSAAISETELERQLLSGEITPEQAVASYCAGESTTKQMDAFCVCPELAVEWLRERLERELVN